MKKRYRLLCALLAMTVFVSGCKFEREIDVGEVKLDLTPSAAPDQSKENVTPTPSESWKPVNPGEVPVTENPVTIVVDWGEPIDGDAVLEYLLGKTREEAKEEDAYWEDYGIDLGLNCYMGYEYTSDDTELYYKAPYINLDGVFSSSALIYMDLTDDAGYVYYNMLGAGSHFHRNEISYRLQRMYQEQELESCSREDAIAACAPLAKACGYENAHVDVYAMTLDDLKREAYDEISGRTATAPGPDCENNPVEWAKEHEAYFLVYSPVLNGRVLHSTCTSWMMCIYVPKYEKVVCARAFQQLVVTETLEETELITQEEAIEQFFRLKGFESVEEVTFKGISMVYSPEYVKTGENVERKTIDPVWRIDYEPSEELQKASGYKYDDWTLLINAKDGELCSYPAVRE